MNNTLIVSFFLTLVAVVPTVFGTTYYLDADGGNDANTGTSEGAAWQTLAHASAQSFQAGDQILLQRGDNFAGKLLIDGAIGTAAQPIRIGAYGTGSRPVVDGAGHLAGVHIRDAAYIEVEDLEITADGGTVVDGSTPDQRYGVFAEATSGNAVQHVTVRNLYIHNIFATVDKATEGADPTTYFGYGVFLSGQLGGQSAHFLVEDCTIERTGHRGIHSRRVNFVNILNNTMTDIGGPAIQPSVCNDVVVRGNVVTRSGSYVDPRMHGRGSGIWPWTCERVLIERNVFAGARGRGDSCGIHIDFNCNHVVVQYNLSIDNSGGFLEILGNCYNNTYRYNISINDGSRVSGVIDQGSLPNNQDGNIIWLSGYRDKSPNDGPYNSYIYNNTIYVGSGTPRAFHFQENARRALITNNIFYIESDTFDGTYSQFDDYTQDMIDSMVWENNLYQRAGIIPTSFPFAETPQTIGDPLFANPGGLAPEDYIPLANALIQDQGRVIEQLPGDAIGLEVGLAVSEDFFGNPIVGLPDMGAIEIENIPVVLPEAAFQAAPAPVSSSSVTMTAVSGPPGTEYYFAETTGNFGGADSGWQSSATFAPGGLLPRSPYAYTVSLRHPSAAADEGPSAPASVETLAPQLFASTVFFGEDFSSLPTPDNRTSPFPAEVWYTLDEAETSSVASTPEGKLRLGWGYDQVTTLYRTSTAWDLSRDYTFTGDWEIAAVLDLHQGITLGFGEFNATNGNLIRRVKGLTVGDLSAPVLGQTGSFTLELSAQEINAAGVAAGSRIGIYIDHPGGFTPNRNDVYLVDNLGLQTSAGLVDSDGDGIPDADEPGLGLDPSDPSDGALNNDGDSFTNVEEHRAGTDLNDSSSFFQPSLDLVGPSASIHLPLSQILSGRWYILEISEDLTNWTIADAVLGSEALSDFTFNFPTGDKGFARFRIEWGD